ncbi:MAG: PilC/PilY family type IV pilus protein [Pseudomonadota bacterium]
MKFIHQLGAILLVLACGCIQSASAEDTDIFLTTPSITGSRPNLLLMLDNAASNNSTITLLNPLTSGDKLEMLRQVLNNIVDPLNSPYFPVCITTVTPRIPADCVTRSEVDTLLNNVNIGLMIANPSGNGKGGYVRYHVRPMNTAANRAGLIAKINPGIPQANNAPYAKSMYEAYQYYGAKSAYVGFDSNQYDNAAKSGTKYVSPATDACQSNYILFVGNGGPDSGENSDSLTNLNGISGVLTTDPVQFTPNNLASSWFDEFARTLKNQDVVPDLTGIQNVTTYTIAVQNPLENNYNTAPVKSSRELLKSAAALGGGEYFLASDGQAVMKAFVDVLQKLQAVDSVFASSTLPVSVNVRGTFLNQVYMGQFRPDAGAGPRWPGNLKQYKIALDVNQNPILAGSDGAGVEDTVNGFLKSTANSFWTRSSNYWSFNPSGNPKSASDAPDGNVVEKGGAAQRLRQDFATSQASRNLYTCIINCTPGAALSTTLFDTVITLPGISDPTEITDLIKWVRGADNRDNEDSNGISTDIRASIHGDVVHSRPAVVNYNRTANDIMVYYGANDGVFHAVKGGQDPGVNGVGGDGGEKWGMVFPEFFGNLRRLRENGPDISTTNPKPYFADGPISVYQYDANNDNKYVAADGDKVYLYIGMRRGGRFAYGLDVSDPLNPKHLWKIDNLTPGFSELGQTWSSLRPTVIKASTDPVVIFGAGYDTENEDPLTATTNNKGRGIFVVNGRTGALIKHIIPSGMGSVPADLTVLDRNSDGFSDRIYANDTKGNVWRMDIDDANPNNWVSYKIASLGGSGANARKFLNKPDVVFGASFDSVLVGSGDREHPFDTIVTNRFYMLKDPKVGLTGGLFCGSVGSERTCVETDLADATSNPFQNTTLPSTVNGWYLTLVAGEKVVGSPITSFGTVFFGTNLPTPPAPGVCSSNLGEARLYSINYTNGAATIDVDSNVVINSFDRYRKLAGGGFPPSAITARVDVDGVTKDVVCTGTKCFGSPGQPKTPDRYRTYWNIEQ